MNIVPILFGGFAREIWTYALALLARWGFFECLFYCFESDERTNGRGGGETFGCLDVLLFFSSIFPVSPFPYILGGSS